MRVISINFDGVCHASPEAFLGSTWRHRLRTRHEVPAGASGASILSVEPRRLLAIAPRREQGPTVPKRTDVDVSL